MSVMAYILFSMLENYVLLQSLYYIMKAYTKNSRSKPIILEEVSCNLQCWIHLVLAPKAQSPAYALHS